MPPLDGNFMIAVPAFTEIKQYVGTLAEHVCALSLGMSIGGVPSSLSLKTPLIFVDLSSNATVTSGLSVSPKFANSWIVSVRHETPAGHGMKTSDWFSRMATASVPSETLL